MPGMRSLRLSSGQNWYLKMVMAGVWNEYLHEITEIYFLIQKCEFSYFFKISLALHIRAW